MNVPILRHIPHSSTYIPRACREDFCLTASELQLEHIHMTDRYVHEFAFSELMQLRFPVSRLVCDAERFRDDADEAMSSVGMGAVYTHGSQRQRIRYVAPARREEILRRYYDAHHFRFTNAVADMLAQYGCCTILDLHSFARAALPYERDAAAERPEICIGTDAFHTSERLVCFTERFFSERGYAVGRNTPFAGTIVPLRFYGINPSVQSLMQEIRRDLYMDEETGRRNVGFLCVQADVRAYQQVLKMKHSVETYHSHQGSGDIIYNIRSRRSSQKPTPAAATVK